MFLTGQHLRCLKGEATLVNFGLSKNMEPETRVSEHPITLHKTCGSIRGRAYGHPKSTKFEDIHVFLGKGLF